MNKFVFLLCMLCFGSIATAQETVVTGTVISGDGEELPGASVVVKGTTIGTVTDMDGFFSIHLPAENATLVVSFVGFASSEVDVTAGTKGLRIVLSEDATVIEEVVVVGYGTMRKSDISGSSVTVGEKKIKGSVITNIDQALQGRVAGVNSVMTSGAPGSSVSIRVRGQATINAGGEPLYVVDGVIVQGGASRGAYYGLSDGLGNGPSGTISPLSTINPSDILSMEILKDASATAIYGAQGANGVVLITTKRGKAGEAKFTYEGTGGLQIQTARLKMMNLREYAEFHSSLAAETNSVGQRPEFQDPSLLGKGTNWQDAIFQHAWMQQHQLSALGGTEKARYYISGSLMDQDGTILGTNFNRYSLRVNFDSELKSWLKLGINAMYSKTSERLNITNGAEGMLTWSLLTPPDIPVYDIYGNYAATVREGFDLQNSIALSLIDENLLDRSKLNGSIFADITLYPNLVWHTELGYDISGAKGETFRPTYNIGGFSRQINTSTIQRNNNLFWQVKNYLTYTGRINKHSFTAMIGQEAWESSWEYIRVSSSNLPSNDVKNPSLGPVENQRIGSEFNSSAMASFFTRETYNYDDRYMFTYTYRYDGSSNFGPKNRWASFHSFAASWRFTNEEFFIWDDMISNGRLRVGWGQTGNSDISSYSWGASTSGMPTGLGMGYRQSNIANPYIQWETQQQWNLGIDVSFINNRFNIVMDFYNKTSANMLMSLQLPTYMGTAGNPSSRLYAPNGNYGTINNKGLEISLETRNYVSRDHGFEWDSNFEISFNRNKLVALDGTANAHIEGYPQWEGIGSPVSLSRIGESLYNFYGYVADGYYKDLADLQNSPKPRAYPSDGTSFNRYNTVWVGDVKFKDISGPEGVPDGIIDEYDRTNIGSPMPKFNFGINNTFRYKNFDLSVFVNGTYGNKIFNYTAIELSGMSSAYRNQLQYVKDRARLEPINPNMMYDGTNGIWNWFDDVNNVRLIDSATPSAPRAASGDPNQNARAGDRYIEDGSYLRIKNITLGYTLPDKLLSRLGIENVRIHANIQNLYTFTKYSGFDPEVGVNPMTPNVYGLDYGRYPTPTIYSMGLNFSF